MIRLTFHGPCGVGLFRAMLLSISMLIYLQSEEQGESYVRLIRNHITRFKYNLLLTLIHFFLYTNSWSSKSHGLFIRVLDPYFVSFLEGDYMQTLAGASYWLRHNVCSCVCMCDLSLLLCGSAELTKTGYTRTWSDGGLQEAEWLQMRDLPDWPQRMAVQCSQGAPQKRCPDPGVNGPIYTCWYWGAAGPVGQGRSQHIAGPVIVRHWAAGL